VILGETFVIVEVSDAIAPLTKRHVLMDFMAHLAGSRYALPFDLGNLDFEPRLGPLLVEGILLRAAQRPAWGTLS
jgi:hypothetical protein